MLSHGESHAIIGRRQLPNVTAMSNTSPGIPSSFTSAPTLVLSHGESRAVSGGLLPDANPMSNEETGILLTLLSHDMILM